MRDRKLKKTIFLVSRNFPEKADSVILLGFECTINTQNLNKKETGNICKGTPDIEFEQDWSVGLDATVRSVTYRKLKTILLVSSIFSGKADHVIFLGFECTISTQNLIKIGKAIFEKFEILIFFLM